MNCEQLHEQLADYLGGELDAAARAEVERHLGGCAACAAEADSLRRALDALRAMPAPAGMAEAADRQASREQVGPAALHPPHRDERRRTVARAARGAAVLRYAAAILIAFTLGYVVRDRSPGESREDGGGPTRVQRGGGPAVASTNWQQRAAEVYAQQSTRSELARSLVALSRVGK